MFNRIIYLLITFCCFSSYADEPTWKWVEVDLESSTLIGYGYTKHIKINDSLGIELLDKNNVRKYFFLCDLNSDSQLCVSKEHSAFSVIYHLDKPTPSIIDLETGEIFDSVETYVLFNKSKMISISIIHPPIELALIKAQPTLFGSHSPSDFDIGIKQGMAFASLHTLSKILPSHL